MRGIELPVNAIVIVALALVALIAIVGFFYPEFFTSTGTVSVRTALNKACIRLLRYNCEDITTHIQTVDFDADMDGIVGEAAINGDNLYFLCRNYYQTPCINQMEGDIDMDCVIWKNDANVCAAAYGCYLGEPCYNPDCDFDNDGYVGSEDLMKISGGYTRTEPEAEKACKNLCNCP